MFSQSDKLKISALEFMHVLIANNVLSESAYVSRYKGFGAEYELATLLKKRNPDRRIYSSCWLIPTVRKAESTNMPVVYMIDQLEPDHSLQNLYSTLDKLPNKGLFYVQNLSDFSDFENWDRSDVMKIGTPLPIPKFRVFTFVDGNFQITNLSELLGKFEDCGRNPNVVSRVEKATKDVWLKKCAQYPIEYLIDLYVDRLLVDGFLGFGKIKGQPADIDLIHPNKTYPDGFTFIEVKEKDLSKTPPVGFGLDVPRFKCMKILKDLSYPKTDYAYVVKQISDQTKREFVDWLCISLTKFDSNKEEKVVQGRPGMRAKNTPSPVYICQKQHFQQLFKASS
ncbi:hypothetical protein [Undibacterium baiyunense]|uniref:Uncharacterized protein n=1 Tax=Undibacterium baiyunense TaxID=2828731 RepID=A0A941DDS0_9BURK|nr:hypothetical protein [Undibacterium baiyunense]MBR7745605.1 hypothetical protein [Undibacterium baiyunense]